MKINCKCCGCPNEVNNESFVVICEACGTEQAVSNIDSEKKSLLFNRANAKRLKCDFDNALSNYEQILTSYPNDPEAHWGILLCKYGIEYIDDKKTNKKIPTCHRTMYSSIFDEIDYKDAIKYADVVAKRIYEEEAKVIDDIQKNIIAISQKEEPYDIFICYKETDESGKRTKDSVIAEELYDELTKKNYKVFFSRITLESKLGQQYEPIIFAALQSSKVMLVLGSKREYFDAIWVKNEWARYLSFMNDSITKKYMIPCYKDMEAYDMPDEFLSLQSQDLDKLGSRQDIIRAIDKIFDRDLIPQVGGVTTQNNSLANTQSLIKRAALLIEDNDYAKADEIIERVLDNDPNCSLAYLYKVVIAKKLKNLDDIKNLKESLADNKDYQRALKYANNDERIVLEEYNKSILKNIEAKKIEDTYNSAIKEKELNDYNHAIELFNLVIDYKDSKNQIEECNNLIIEERYEKYTSLVIRASNINTFDKELFDKSILELKEIIYYKDTSEFISKYEAEINETIKQIEEEKQKAKEKTEYYNNMKKRKYSIVLFSFLAASVTIILLYFFLLAPLYNYNVASNLLKEGKYDEAKEIFSDMYFSDSKEQVSMINARDAFESGDYEKGIDYIYNIGGKVKVSYNSDKEVFMRPDEVISLNSYIGTPTAAGYEFEKWNLEKYDLDYQKYSATIKLVPIYKIIKYPIYLKWNPNHGHVYGQGGYEIGKVVALTANPKEGYSFDGWYLIGNGEKLSSDRVFNYKVNGEELNLEARFTSNDVSYTISHRKYNSYYNTYNEYETENGTTKMGSTVVLTPKEYEGYYCKNPDEKFTIYSINQICNLLYYPNTYKVNVTSNLYGCEIIAPSSYLYTTDVKLETTYKSGFSFQGWYINGEYVSNSYKYTIERPIGDLDVEARYVGDMHIITVDTETSDIDISGVTSGTKYEAGSKVEINAINIPKNHTILWSRSDGFTYKGDSYSFYMPTDDITISAKYVPIYEIVNNIIYMGSYPQTRVTDAILIYKLDNLAGNLNSWNTYDYINYNNVTNFMFYKDLDVDGDGTFDYRGVYFKEYKTNDRTLEDATTQKRSGYETYKYYWFKYEPIGWKIINEENGKYYILSTMVLDSQPYDYCYNKIDGEISPKSITYETSYIRNYVNNTMYDTLFNPFEKSLIQTANLDNGLYNFDVQSVTNKHNSTNDNLFISSVSEMKTYFAINRSSVGATDYVKCLGYGENVLTRDISYETNSSLYIAQYYYSHAYCSSWTSKSICGVRPACYIKAI